MEFRILTMCRICIWFIYVVDEVADDALGADPGRGRPVKHNPVMIGPVPPVLAAHAMLHDIAIADEAGDISDHRSLGKADGVSYRGYAGPAFPGIRVRALAKRHEHKLRDNRKFLFDGPGYGLEGHLSFRRKRPRDMAAFHPECHLRERRARAPFEEFPCLPHVKRIA